MKATVASSSVTEPEAVLLVEVRAIRLLMFLPCRRLAIATWGYVMPSPVEDHSQDALGSAWRVDDAGSGNLVVLGVNLDHCQLSLSLLRNGLNYCAPLLPSPNSPGPQPRVRHQ